jgi:hypothetical protein
MKKKDKTEPRFKQAKRAYMAAEEKVQAMGIELENTLDSRDKAYQ